MPNILNKCKSCHANIEAYRRTQYRTNTEEAKEDTKKRRIISFDNGGRKV